ncbi:MAG: hypothetical protein FWE20_06805 [Defluviitaleaceae bacterium]|nr:hypothetical protein [Defluviitaleaceae bacterium]
MKCYFSKRFCLFNRTCEDYEKGIDECSHMLNFLEQYFYEINPSPKIMNAFIPEKPSIVAADCHNGKVDSKSVYEEIYGRGKVSDGFFEFESIIVNIEVKSLNFFEYGLSQLMEHVDQYFYPGFKRHLSDRNIGITFNDSLLFLRSFMKDGAVIKKLSMLIEDDLRKNKQRKYHAYCMDNSNNFHNINKDININELKDFKAENKLHKHYVNELSRHVENDMQVSEILKILDKEEKAGHRFLCKILTLMKNHKIVIYIEQNNQGNHILHNLIEPYRQKHQRQPVDSYEERIMDAFESAKGKFVNCNRSLSNKKIKNILLFTTTQRSLYPLNSLFGSNQILPNMHDEINDEKWIINKIIELARNYDVYIDEVWIETIKMKEVPADNCNYIEADLYHPPICECLHKVDLKA